MSTRCPAHVKRTAVTTRGGYRGHVKALLAAPAPGRALVGAAEEGERRPEEDQEVGLPVVVAHVPEVELDPLSPGERGAPVDLRPARDPRLDVEAVELAFVVLVDLVAERGPRPNDRHVAAHDVPELRQLVEAEPAQDPAHLGD